MGGAAIIHTYIRTYIEPHDTRSATYIGWSPGSIPFHRLCKGDKSDKDSGGLEPGRVCCCVCVYAQCGAVRHSAFDGVAGVFFSPFFLRVVFHHVSCLATYVLKERGRG